jgi:hypothetical protein
MFLGPVPHKISVFNRDRSYIILILANQNKLLICTEYKFARKLNDPQVGSQLNL